jgi:metal-dependent amidase/aminoacylase/carboxypeptidase family protein
MEESMRESILAQARSIEPRIRELRRAIHRNPEPAYEEHETAKLVAGTLEGLGLEVRTGVARTGVVGLLHGRGQGRVLGLRADMDALRKDEAASAEERPWRSQNPGIMHACGHDGHVAVLLGAAEVLKNLSSEFDGAVKFFFQPAEEGGAGGRLMVEEGALADPDVEAVFALHGWPNLPCGHVGLRYGTSMATAAQFILDIEGQSGHAAYPHKCVDPVPAAAQIVSALQTIRSREVNPNVGSVVSITVLSSGSRPSADADPWSEPLRPSQSNIIPQFVRLQGTSRALTMEGQELQLGRIRSIAESVGKAFRAKVAFHAEEGYPPTINDRDMTDLAAQTAKEMLGEDKVAWLPEPSMGGEDFSYYLQKVPGSMFRLGMARGTTPEELAREPALHSDDYDWNDDALVAGMAMMAGLAWRFLGEPPVPSSGSFPRAE